MPINDKFFYINIRDYLALGNNSKAGEPMLTRVLSGFSCPKNPDVEHFLKNSAVEFTQKSQSVTYLVFSVEGKELVGYFTLALKPLSVKGETVSNTMKRKLLRISELDESSDTYTMSAYLIAQLGKNYTRKYGVFASINIIQVIKWEKDIATVTIFGQEWLDFAGLSEYRFYKTSDVPNIDEFPANQQESNMQDSADTGSEAATDELLDSFINGQISAVDPGDLTSAFYITDLKMDSEEWDAYSIGEKVDLDNDGENELIINGPYGGIYLDARDNKVYEFAEAEGTALVLSYTYYNGAVWIMYSNISSAGIEFYHMEKFEGADNLTAEINFGEEFDINNPEAGVKYTLNETEISYDEYTALCSKIFAAEVSTS